MTDTKQHNKDTAQKRPLLRKIGRGIYALLYVYAISVLVALHAPSIVLTFLIVLFFVDTVGPKSVRKWFGRAIIAGLIVFVAWVFLPDDNKGWRPYTLDRELLAMEAKRAIPDEENAALIYNRLLETYDPNSFDTDFLVFKSMTMPDPNSSDEYSLHQQKLDAILSDFWKSKDHPEVASWLQEQQHVIDELMKACKKDLCRFPIAGDIGTAKSDPPSSFDQVAESWPFTSGKRWGAMGNWSELLTISANNDIAEGRIDRGLEKYRACLRIAEHLHQQPTDTDLLTGSAINMKMLKRINQFVITGYPTAEQLQQLKDASGMFKYDWRSDLHSCLDREKLMLKNLVCAMFYQTNETGDVRLNRDPRSSVRAQIDFYLIPMVPPEDPDSPHEPMDPDSYFQIKLTKAMSVLCRCFVPSDPGKTCDMIDDLYEGYYSMAESEYDWEQEPDEFSLLSSLQLNFGYFLDVTSRIFLPYWESIRKTYLRAETQQRGSQLLIALREYKNKNGCWPRSLEQLKPFAPARLFVDPANKGSFVYRPSDESFTLYSKGRNAIDETYPDDSPDAEQPYSASYRQKHSPKEKPDDIHIWPPEIQCPQAAK